MEKVMSDQEKLTNLLTEFGVRFTVEEYRLTSEENDAVGEDLVDIKCSEGDAKVGGYGCFYTAFTFDADGKFRMMGAWE